MNILQIESFSVSNGTTLAVDNINFNVKEGDLLGILGPNGAGKTTLFRAILGLQKYQGKMNLFGHGKEFHSELVPLIGYVPQKFNLESNFPATVFDIISMGKISEKKLGSAMSLLKKSNQKYYKSIEVSNNDDKVHEVLKIVGLESLRDRRIGELSGGEQQRTLIAKAIVNEPPLLILDEPVTGIDVEVQKKFYDLLKNINEEKKITIVWASHDLSAISNLANKVACMNKKLFFHGQNDEFFSNEDLLKTYTESAMHIHLHNHM